MNDIVGFIAASLTTFAFLPQAIKTWKTKSTGDLSPVMYSVLVTGIICWLVYGIIIVNWPMIFANSVTLSFSSVILYYVLKNRVDTKVEHIALWVEDMEKMKDFYIGNFGGVSGDIYVNKAKDFKSCFLTLGNGVRIELMHTGNKKQQSYSHIALSVGSKDKVDKLTEMLSEKGFKIVGNPRITGDGYYESVIEDPEKNLIELTV
jgi:lactoylglutathione lyase